MAPPGLNGALLAAASIARVAVERAHADDERFDRLARAVAVDRDHQAFAQLFASLAPRLKGWLVRSGSSAEVADELVQDTFVVLWRKAAMFDERRSGVGGWLYAIARNLRIDRHRCKSEAWLSLDDDMMSTLADPATPIEEGLAARRSAAHLREALARLRSDERQFLHWSFYDERSHADIARDLGVPLGTVKTRIRRAAAKLRQFLEGTRT
jgi:RNA polymerase sigma-70 factor (ECF subfamily)